MSKRKSTYKEKLNHYKAEVRYIGIDSFKRSFDDLVVERLCYFDVLTIKVNNLAYQIQCEELLSGNNRIKHEFSAIFEKTKYGFSPRIIGFSLKLWRPDDDLLKELIDILRRADYTISLIEIAVDFVTKRKGDVWKLMKLVRPLLVVKKIQNKPTFRRTIENRRLIKFSLWFRKKKSCSSKDGTNSEPKASGCSNEGCKNKETSENAVSNCGETTTQNSEATDKKKKRKAKGNLFKIYGLNIDPKKRPRKHGKPALHTEFRFEGSKKISQEVIFCLTDLVNFDFINWYNERIKIMQAPRSPIGASLRKKKKLSTKDRDVNTEYFYKEFCPKKSLSHEIYHRKELRNGLEDWTIRIL
ncbi:hypothetical protein [Thiorhodovibrio frisius]|uniref:Uncharacterized protein n=1 Tax=Thiorhodovibrio frisius TaxID=631362 RepID=H8Z2S8_9GAMM|nr:hypothetical protein [Thiorhodovibrio frisius]EIC21664.1 hypothetical protein Thi970DRAFT_01884 [Thiorhodovibrio frisius]WPL21633.1 hypothetical protein Thiofri_01759 [Thiorhodovibrio frisius]